MNDKEEVQVEEQVIPGRTLDEQIRHIYYDNPDFKEDRRFQYMSGGKLFQTVAKLPPHPSARRQRPVFVSVCIDHTPNSKYTGAMLRELRKERGVGVNKKNRKVSTSSDS
jgi:hypothetical protein